MKTYTIEMTIVDQTQVNATTKEEAYKLALEVFIEAGYDTTENDLAIIEERDGDL